MVRRMCLYSVFHATTRREIPFGDRSKYAKYENISSWYTKTPNTNPHWESLSPSLLNQK